MAESLLIASHRGPVGFRVAEDGSLVARRGGGGLVTGLAGLAAHTDLTWVAWAASDGDVEAAARAGAGAIEERTRGGAPYHLRLVGAPDANWDHFYNVIANPLLWFVMHRLYGFGWEPTIDRGTHAAWRGYRDVNERMAAGICVELDRAVAAGEPLPTVIVHDYHLFLVPGLVAAKHPEVTMQFFLHIPWPDPGAWRCIPRSWLREVGASLLACDVVGLQTSKDVASFLRTMGDKLEGAELDLVRNTVRMERRTDRHGDGTPHQTWVRDYPISISPDEFDAHAAGSGVARLRERIAELRPGGPDGDGTLIVRVDRTDPSKNIVRGFQSFGLLLHEHPELHRKVTMFCQLDPSRQDIPEYARYRRELEAAADEVNHAFGAPGWQPIHLNIDSNFAAAVAAYLEYDVLFVNPVADGMNLVSKEGPLVNVRDGAVVLSSQAGAFNELAPWVVPVNPFDVAHMADALHEAITLDPERRAERAAAIRRQVREHDISRWIDAQLDDLATVRAAGELVPRRGAEQRRPGPASTSALAREGIGR